MGNCAGGANDRELKLSKIDTEKYQKFWKQFGNVLKEGPAEDFGNKEQIAGLLRFASTRGEGSAKTVSLQDYLARKAEDQEAIYYICAETYETASRSPHLEVFRDQDVEVLLLFDRIDEWLEQGYYTFRDGFIRLHRGVRYGSRSNPRFVGKGTTADSQ